MAAATPQIIPEQSQVALIQFHRACYNMLNEQWNIREQMRTIDLAYAREADLSVEQLRAKSANRLGDPTRFQNVTIPVVKPQVEAAVQYQSAVFLTSDPLFGWVADPANMDAATMYTTIIEENARRGGWVSELMKFFRDGFKYNLCALEVAWDRKTTASIETDLGMSLKEGRPKEVIWEGNCLRRWDLYNTFFDTRYPATDIYKDGEFAGRTELMSRVHLKKFINELPDKMVANIRAAFESGLGSAGVSPSGIESYYIPSINPDALINKDPRRSMDWLSWSGLLLRPENEILYQNLYEVTTLYARIIPQDFRLRVPSANTPQVWKFIIVNHQVLIYAERQTNAHNFIPVLFGQPNDDGLRYQTKSLAQDALPFQEVASALVNSAMAARRRAISDRTIYDPSRITAAHINSDNPSAKIPLRPAGYGKPASEAVYAFPFKDDQSAVAFQEIPQILAMADKLNGQNPVRSGQFVKGNKNNPEFQAVMAAATGNDQLRALVFEDQVFTPAREIIKLNTLQYQASGSIFSPKLQRTVQIDVVSLRKAAATFTTTDGLSSAEKQIHTDEFTVALQTIGSSPQIGAGYNIAPMFSYLMKTRNVDLKPFEKSPEQMTYEQAVGAWNVAAENVAEIIKTVSVKVEGVTFDQIQGLVKSLLPPQPTPQQFGYTPGAPTQEPQTQAASNSPVQGAQ